MIVENCNGNRDSVADTERSPILRQWRTSTASAVGSRRSRREFSRCDVLELRARDALPGRPICLHQAKVQRTWSGGGVAETSAETERLMTASFGRRHPGLYSEANATLFCSQRHAVSGGAA